ncbi:unnamed protein product [Moneuplotes crassus]|uniref:Uncharacterized protein n=1 Tax=Euplotes crassus TaxID=5936 RepID=A0AAD2D7G1_EUPCR|nr:unnamed protein product [Moneuplotes crassus]
MLSLELAWVKHPESNYIFSEYMSKRHWPCRSRTLVSLGFSSLYGCRGHFFYL